MVNPCKPTDEKETVVGEFFLGADGAKGARAQPDVDAD
jgi:hypothetical protein